VKSRNVKKKRKEKTEIWGAFERKILYYGTAVTMEA